MKPYFKVNVDFPTRTAKIHQLRCGTIPFVQKRPENGHWKEFNSQEEAHDYAASLDLLHVGNCQLCM